MPIVSRAIRRRIAAAAGFRCGYCQTQERVIGMPLEIDHIIPEALGGSSAESSLWLACPRCNRYKGKQSHAEDPQSGQTVPLFAPRRQVWAEHFVWQLQGLTIAGLTPTGRATVDLLRFNNPFIVRARRAWITAGLHPPTP